MIKHKTPTVPHSERNQGRAGGVKRQQITLTLAPETLAWLATKPNKSRAIDSLVSEVCRG